MKNLLGTLSFTFLASAKSVFNIFIENDKGDTICKMSRSDCESDAVQKEYARVICEAVNNHDRLVRCLSDLVDVCDGNYQELTDEAKQILLELKKEVKP